MIFQQKSGDARKDQEMLAQTELFREAPMLPGMREKV
jgi:hypothetical protein